eukprot:7380881-Prymnesium_polylepis.1
MARGVRAVGGGGHDEQSCARGMLVSSQSESEWSFRVSAYSAARCPMGGAGDFPTAARGLAFVAHSRHGIYAGGG